MNKPDYIESKNNLITERDPQIVKFFASLDRLLDRLELMAKECKPTLNGERYLTDKDVAALLNVSRRTLHEYRSERKIPHCLLGGKILYRESDVQKMLEENYKKAYR